MKDVNEAMEALAGLLGVGSLAFNDNGQAAILVENAVTVDISRQSETELELSTSFDELAGELTLSRLIVLMQSNYLGHYTGAARIALDPRDGVPLLCQHLDVTTLDIAGIESALVSFIGYATYWLDEGIERILAVEDMTPVKSAPMQGASEEHMFMRL